VSNRANCLDESPSLPAQSGIEIPTALIAMPRTLMKESIKKAARYLFVGLGIYAVLAALYFLAVLRFLGSWLNWLFHEHRPYYVVASILIMVGQAVGLERLLTALSYFVSRGKK
jgi:uncharacterized oligopeptide transporter (OPT) family protein